MCWDYNLEEALLGQDLAHWEDKVAAEHWHEAG